MGLFSGLFSGKQGRLQQIYQANQLAEQQAAADQQQQELQRQLAEAAADRDRQLAILQEQGNASLAAAAETARLAQKQADEANYRASLTAGDSEDARLTADERLRKLQGKRGFLSTVLSRANGGGLGAAPVSSAQLLGAAA